MVKVNGLAFPVNYLTSTFDKRRMSPGDDG